MGTPFALVARPEVKTTTPNATLWAAVRVDPVGKPLEAERAPLALTVVIDISGSMNGPPIEHVVKSCELLLVLLDARDRVSFVTFNNAAAILCGLTTVDDVGRALLKQTLGQIRVGGGTNIHAGLQVAAGMVMTAPSGLRRAMVLMSDGQPNDGLVTPDQLGAYVRGLGVAVSTLGFGLQHNEDVLLAVATAGSGRYAYIPNPSLARVELARAALAHGGIVADKLELKVKLADGVELLGITPSSQLRMGAAGLTTALGDVFVDAGRLVALELKLDLPSGAPGTLAEIIVTGRSPDGVLHEARAKLELDVRTGTPIVDRDAQRDVLMVRADAVRAEARAQADRRAYPAAAALIKTMIATIDASDGFVRNDGSLLSELREQLQDEADAYERTSTDVERGHQRKASQAYSIATPSYQKPKREQPPIAGALIGIAGSVTGQRFELWTDNSVGRGAHNDIVVPSGQLSRMHARITFVKDHFSIHDMGSTNGCKVNGHQVIANYTALRHSDVIEMGDAHFKFELA